MFKWIGSFFVIGLLTLTLSAASAPAVHAQPPTGGSSHATFTMLGKSMEPTLHNNQVVLLDRTAYTYHAPQRGDIVVFRAVPAGAPNRLFLKRIIGLPGERVAVRGGSVYINDRRLIEPYVLTAAGYVFHARRVPRNSYFVLGDNRNNSEDSHLWLWLPRADIVGKIVMPYLRG